MAHAREKWVDWRCKQIAKWFLSIVDRISARRPDLRLSICSYKPTVTDFGDDPRYGQPGFPLLINRESGFDPALYKGLRNIIIDQTTYPADYRWSDAAISASHPSLRTE